MRPKSNDSAFFPARVTLATGIEVELPRFTLRKDEQVRHVLRRVLDNNELGLSAALVSDNKILRWLGLSLSRAPEDLLEIGSLILEREAKWVENHCDTADLVELVGSFVLTPVDESDQGRVEQGEVWSLAKLIDFLASEYGWTINDVLDSTRWELKAILQAVSDRYEEKNRQMKNQKTGRKSAVRPGRRKYMTPEKSKENVDALRAFAQSRGTYEHIQGGGTS